MTLKIEVYVPQDHVENDGAADYLAKAMRAIGFIRSPMTQWVGECSLLADEVLAEEGPNYAAMKAAAEAFAATEPASTEPEPAAEEPKKRGRKPKAAEEPTANISTGEERIDPTSAEDAAQDAADEAAEVEETRDTAATADDVRAAMNRYVKAFGMAATQEDGPKILRGLFGDGVDKVSLIPAEAAAYARAAVAFDEAIASNPYNRSKL